MNISGEIFAALFYLYFLIYIGMGITQPIAAVIRIIVARRKNSTYALGLKKYLLSVCVYFLILYLMTLDEQNFNSLDIVPIYVMILPWAFSIWYIRHTRIWKKKFKNIAAYENLQKLNAPHKNRVLLESYPTQKVEIKYPIGTLHRTKMKRNHEAIIKTLPSLILAK